MWTKESSKINYYDALCFNNDDLNSVIQKIVLLNPIIKNSSLISYQYLVIVFTNHELAYKFFMQNPEVILQFSNNYPGVNSRCITNYINISDLHFKYIECDLFKDKLSDLETFRENLKRILPDLPIEIFDAIVVNPRELMDLEINFYDNLKDLNPDNFICLLREAHNIINTFDEVYGNNLLECYHSKVLWELALECKEKILIDEWLETLKSIPSLSNYYSRAQEELGCFILNEFSDHRENFEEQIDWLNNGLKYAINSLEHSGFELAQKITLTFLGVEWFNKKQVFSGLSSNLLEEKEGVDYIVDLIVYAKKLKEENLQLKQQFKDLPIGSLLEDSQEEALVEASSSNRYTL